MATPLKEMKIPKYTKGTSYDDYVIKMMSAASTRGRMKEVLDGDFMELMPAYDALGVRGVCNADQLSMEAENRRALA